MRRARTAIAAVALATLTACAQPAEPATVTTSTHHFVDGSSVAALAQSGTVRIGVMTGLPGLGYLEPGAPEGTAPKGFDIEVAKLIAADLGIAADAIQWVPLDSLGREQAILDGKVDLVVGAFSMTDERAQSVGQIGPYYMTGQQVLVADDSSITGLDDLDGKSVCAVPDAEPGAEVLDKGAATKAYTTFGACVDDLLTGDLDAIASDAAILAGFVDAHPDDLRIVGEPFTTQRYAIGYQHGDSAMCSFLRESLLKAYSSGDWKDAFESTLGASGIEAPTPPRPDECPA